MQDGTDRWKTDRAEALTKAGWDNENAQRQADREQTAMLAEKDASLQRELESGRITLEEKKLAQEAFNFSTEMDFKKWCEQNNIDEAAAQRAWVTSERVASEAHKSYESSLDRILTKEIEQGRLNLEDLKLQQDAMQFSDKLQFDEWAKRQDISSEKAAQIWATNERIATEKHRLNMQEIEGKLAEKGIKMTSLMSYLEGLDADQAGDVMEQFAKDVGISYVVKDAEGKPVYNEDGTVKTEAGLQPFTGTTEDKGINILAQIKSGELDTAKFIGAAKGGSMAEEYTSLASGLGEFNPSFTKDADILSNDEFKFKNPPTKGDVIKRDGVVYQVSSSPTMKKHGDITTQEFQVTDISSGTKYTIKVKVDGYFRDKFSMTGFPNASNTNTTTNTTRRDSRSR
jgi:hypothetical protein